MTSLQESAVSGLALNVQGMNVSAAAKSTRRRGKSTADTSGKQGIKTLGNWMQEKCQPLTYSPQDSLARLFHLLENGSALQTLEARYFLKLLGLQSRKDLDTCSLKTLRDYYSMMKEGRSEPFSLHLMSWGMMRNGRLCTAAISFHREGSASSLSDILERNPSSKYSLSERQKKRLAERSAHIVLTPTTTKGSTTTASVQPLQLRSQTRRQMDVESKHLGNLLTQ